MNKGASGAHTGLLRNRARRVRRWAAAAIVLAGATDLLAAIVPSIRDHLGVVARVLPLTSPHAPGALAALAGVALIGLARGTRRGQRPAWAVSVLLFGVFLVVHLLRGGAVGSSVVAGIVLALLVSNRREFRSSPDLTSVRVGGAWLVGVAVVAIGGSALTVELTQHSNPTGSAITPRLVAKAVVERLVGVQHVALPAAVNGFLAPALVAVGFAIAVLALWLVTRPLVDRRPPEGEAAWAAARDIIGRHGGGTLDYFALREDKRWFFWGDSLVAYAVFGGVCLVSPDPIGPVSERASMWDAFWRFAESCGWSVAVMAGSEEWLALYGAKGMHHIYIGDEAVVDVRHFSLAGGHRKGLRQARNRIANHGYTAEFFDPSLLERDQADRLSGLLPQGRRGEFERGFSMMLGRLFDRHDEGLLLCVVTGPDGEPAAICHLVPAPDIGGYSLDLMRRDRGEHPNGLVDFALVSTIEHLRENGGRGFSLYFSGLRAVLDGEGGDGPIRRAEQWAVKKMSTFLPIETLVRFNAKYGPEWLPRYVVYPSAEYLPPVLLAILRAESLDEVPVIGPLAAAVRPGGRRGRSSGRPSTPAEDPVALSRS
jgi:lysylphosphatidylglycerol synthetase-like protein (DUF2156 family)